MNMFLMLLSSIIIILLLTPTASSITCHQDDLTALMAIKSSFKNNHRLGSWNPKHTACCKWFGLACNSQGHVTTVSIYRDPDLSGSIPPAIGNLTSLTDLTLYDLPNLTGPIPSSLSRLTNLTILDLSHNSLTGPIPLFVSRLTKLEYLDLSHNRLSSQIPATLSSLVGLQTLRLHYNRLYGPLPNTFSNFPRSSPPLLYLSHNRLTGLIWDSIGDPDWRVFDVGSNRLMGDASVLFGKGKKAEVIDISDNRFEFELTNVRFQKTLKVLDLSGNRIYGSIPAQMNELLLLQEFNVSSNELCGEIPKGIVTSRFGRGAYEPHLCLCGWPLDPCK